MRSFRFGPKKGSWLVVTTWYCKYENRSLCPCCEPKGVISPTVLRGLPSDIREHFRQNDSIGKSRTPRAR